MKGPEFEWAPFIGEFLGIAEGLRKGFDRDICMKRFLDAAARCQLTVYVFEREVKEFGMGIEIEP